MVKKSFSILLSLILLTSHMYLAVGTHYCSGEAVETKILLGKTHLGCNMPEMEEPFDYSEKTNKNRAAFDKLPCCENEYQTAQVTNEFLKDLAGRPINSEFAAAFIYTTLNLDLFSKSTYQFYPEYISPSLEKDIQVFFQTFLIWLFNKWLYTMQNGVVWMHCALINRIYSYCNKLSCAI